MTDRETATFEVTIESRPGYEYAHQIYRALRRNGIDATKVERTDVPPEWGQWPKEPETDEE